MIFTEFLSWVILLLVLFFLLLFKNSPRGRNIYLALVGFALYYESEGVLLSLLMFVTLSDYLIARGIAASGKNSVKRLLLTLGIMFDVLLLSYFKYASFFTGIINGIFSLQLQPEDIFPLSGLVPLGISFYIFKSIGYMTDVFRGTVRPVKNILDYALFTTFFPSLLSGPILRADQFVPQIYKPYFLPKRYFGTAVFWILTGLAKKVILGDFLAVNFIDRVYDNARLFSGFENLCAVFSYSLQLYADFSGYTDIAVGVALLLGFHIPQNFDFPYTSTDAQVFWKKWHISLSRWLQDYLYYPLGGNRKISVASLVILLSFIAVTAFTLKSRWVVISAVAAVSLAVLYFIFAKNRRKYLKGAVNTMATMLLGGLWHGASANFVLWGGLNGIGIVASRLVKTSPHLCRWMLTSIVCAALILLRMYCDMPIVNVFLAWAVIVFLGNIIRWKGWKILQTFIFMSFAFIFFRSGSFEDATCMLRQIGDPTQWDIKVVWDVTVSYWKVLALFAFGMIFHLLPSRVKRLVRINFALAPVPVLVVVSIVAVLIIYQFSSAEPHPFIYFQF